MKQLLFLICCVCLFAGCKKGTNAISSSIQGLWELRHASGMFTTNYAPGNGNTIKFTDGRYETTTNGQPTKSGSYQVVQDLSVGAETCLVIGSGQYTNRIIYDNDLISRKVFVEISNNKLSFLSGCFAYDAGSFVEYERQ
jgi:hypothetical protein